MQTTTGPRSWTVRIECISSWKDFYSNQDGTMAPQKKHLNVIDTIANWLERAQYERSGSMDTFVLPPHEIIYPCKCYRYVTLVDVRGPKRGIQEAITSKSGCDLPAEKPEAFIGTCCSAHPTSSTLYVRNHGLPEVDCIVAFINIRITPKSCRFLLIDLFIIIGVVRKKWFPVEHVKKTTSSETCEV